VRLSDGQPSLGRLQSTAVAPCPVWAAGWTLCPFRLESESLPADDDLPAAGQDAEGANVAADGRGADGDVAAAAADDDDVAAADNAAGEAAARAAVAELEFVAHGMQAMRNAVSVALCAPCQVERPCRQSGRMGAVDLERRRMDVVDGPVDEA